MKTSEVIDFMKKKSIKIRRSSGDSYLTINVGALSSFSKPDEDRVKVHSVGKPLSANRPNVNECILPDGLEVTNQGGVMITNPVVHVIFWGIDWFYATNPSLLSVLHSIDKIIESNYTSALDQYGVNKPVLSGEITVINDPEPEQGFTNEDVGNLVWNLIRNRELFPHPNDGGENNLFMVMMPPGLISSYSRAGGAHGYINITNPYANITDTNNAWFGWARYGPLNNITMRFSHELIEACTDPESPPAFQMYLNKEQAHTVGHVTQDGTGVEGWVEISDVCICSELMDGVMVNPYWSQRDGKCVAPGNQLALGGTSAADIVIDAKFHIVDDHFIGSSECDFHLTHTVLLNTKKTSSQFVIPTPIVGREVRVELIINVELNSEDYSVSVDLTARLYDGRDIDDSYSEVILLQSNAFKNKIINLRADENWADTAHIDVSFSNVKTRVNLPSTNTI